MYYLVLLLLFVDVVVVVNVVVGYVCGVDIVVMFGFENGCCVFDVVCVVCYVELGGVGYFGVCLLMGFNMSVS